MLSNQLYLEDLKRINEADLPWEELENCKILVTGGTGLIGSCLVDASHLNLSDMGSFMGGGKRQ